MNQKKYWEKIWENNGKQGINIFAKKAYKIIKEKGLKTLLDVGSGDGTDALFFAKKGLQVTALDISETGLLKLKRVNPEIKTVCRDLRKIELKNNSFDVIYAHLSLHYFDDQTTDKIFSCLHKVLKKGGLIFVKCKSIEDPLFGQGTKIGENIFFKEHTRHFFTKEYMAEKLKNFKIIRINKSSSIYHFHKSAFIEAIAEKTI